MESWSHFTYLPSLVAVSKESACNAGDLGLIPGMGRSPGEGKGNPFQYSGLENFMNWIVHGVTKSWTQLNDFHFTSHRNDYAVDHFLCPLHRIFNTITLWVTYSYYPHFTGEEYCHSKRWSDLPKISQLISWQLIRKSCIVCFPPQRD